MMSSWRWPGYLSALTSRLFQSCRRKRERRSPFPSRRLLIERLEDRTLLATASLLPGGVLDIAGDQSLFLIDTIAVSSDGSNFSVASTLGTQGTVTFAVSDVQAINVHGGGTVTF